MTFREIKTIVYSVFIALMLVGGAVTTAQLVKPKVAYAACEDNECDGPDHCDLGEDASCTLTEGGCWTGSCDSQIVTR